MGYLLQASNLSATPANLSMLQRNFIVKSPKQGGNAELQNQIPVWPLGYLLS